MFGARVIGLDVVYFVLHEFYGSWHISKGYGHDDLPEADLLLTKKVKYYFFVIYHKLGITFV